MLVGTPSALEGRENISGRGVGGGLKLTSPPSPREPRREVGEWGEPSISPPTHPPSDGLQGASAQAMGLPCAAPRDISSVRIGTKQREGKNKSEQRSAHCSLVLIKKGGGLLILESVPFQEKARKERLQACKKSCGESVRSHHTRQEKAQGSEGLPHNVRRWENDCRARPSG